MRQEATQPNDPEEMTKARETSWLSQVFQERCLSPEEKQRVLKSICKDIREKNETIREENTPEAHQ